MHIKKNSITLVLITNYSKREDYLSTDYPITANY